MIVFEKKVFGTNLMFYTQLVGSSFPKAFWPAVISIIIYIILIHVIPEDTKNNYVVNDTYTYGIAASAIGFLVVFRLNQAHIRLSEAAQDVYLRADRVVA